MRIELKNISHFFSNSKVLLRYAWVWNDWNTVNRVWETAEILLKNSDNICWISQEYWLDTTYKKWWDKVNKLVEQEVKTVEFFSNFLKNINQYNDEIWIVHKTNMDKIIRQCKNILPENKAFYGELDFWETYEIDLKNSWDKFEIIQEKNNNFLQLTSSNYLSIISELEKTENIPENIKNGIDYFKDWKIKIIDLQNVINKNIWEYNSFLEQFKNSENIFLRKLAFINILKEENLLDEETEELILENKFGEKVEEIIDYFSIKLEKYKDNFNIDLIKSIETDFSYNLYLLEKNINLLKSLNSNKLIDIYYISKIIKIVNFLYENKLFTEKTELNWILKNWFSDIFTNNFPELVKKFDLENSRKNEIFISGSVAVNHFWEISFWDINLSKISTFILEPFMREVIFSRKNEVTDMLKKSYDEDENEEVIVLDKSFKNEISLQILDYIKHNKILEPWYNLPFYILLKFDWERVVFEKLNIVYRENDILRSDIFKLEEFISNWIRDWVLDIQWRILIERYINTPWFKKFLSNIVWMDIKFLYIEIIKLLRWVDEKLDQNIAVNDENFSTWLHDRYLEKNLDGIKKLLNKDDKLFLWNNFFKKISFYNILIFKYLYPEYKEDDVYKYETIEIIKFIFRFLKD